MSYCQIEAGASTDQGFRARQQARTARRARIAEKEAKRQRVIKAVEYVAWVLVGFVFLYLLLFYAAL